MSPRRHRRHRPDTGREQTGSITISNVGSVHFHAAGGGPSAARQPDRPRYGLVPAPIPAGAQQDEIDISLLPQALADSILSAAATGHPHYLTRDGEPVLAVLPTLLANAVLEATAGPPGAAGEAGPGVRT